MLKRIVKASLLQRIARAVDAKLSTTTEFGDVKAIELIADRVLQLASEKGFSENQRYELLYEICRKLQPEFSINDRGRYFLKDETFRSYFERFAVGNWKNYERRWTLGELLRLLPDIPGDLAECGVYEGATAYRLCQFAKERGRKVHLFDSFQGLSAPKENDGTHWAEGGLSVSEATVRANLAEFDCFETFPGWIPERFAEVADRQFSFVHIDVDLEQPTYDSIAFFYPRTAPGAVMVLDDHGYDTCPGARKAVLEYMADKREPVLDLPTGQGLIIKAPAR